MDIITELSELVGIEPVIKLGQMIGGARIYVPINITKDHLLTLAIGEELAQKICDRFAGDTIEMPNKFLFRVARNKLIKRDYHLPQTFAKGSKADLIAMKYGISRRHVFNIIKVRGK